MTLIARSCLDLGLYSSTLPTTGNIWLQTLGYHLNQIFVNLNGDACVGNQVLTVPVLISELLVWPFTLIFRIWPPPRTQTLDGRACFVLAHLPPKSKSPHYALFLVLFST